MNGGDVSSSAAREAVIDLAAFRHNIGILASLAMGGPLVIDATADAYGHGLVPIARAAAEAGVDILSVRDPRDAIRVAEAGIRIDVHSWHGERFSLPPAGSGIAAFGYGMHLTDGAPDGLVPVMTLSAPVSSVKTVGAGHGVSYGFIYRTTDETTLALIPLGYADGIPRSATGHAAMAVNGVAHPVVGTIAMDQIVLDTGDSRVALGDRGVVFGPGLHGEPTAEEWARVSGSTPGEILARVGRRVQRRYTEMGSA
ncbi:alanine racemase [Agreia sp. COWG]|uniref:alanine racemase n=1 Tax=Agreia sp. COWG TaxID=2773266 RepID=UPI0019257B72|nr:alanine racemase C-terminal domain-containing protein [Agreia sp. COWG]CAD6004302.1 Alanine racemase, N-terminal domain [Agreia sp. COWG]